MSSFENVMAEMANVGCRRVSESEEDFLSGFENGIWDLIYFSWFVIPEMDS